jgi:hypothetical protein
MPAHSNGTAGRWIAVVSGMARSDSSVARLEPTAHHVTVVSIHIGSLDGVSGRKVMNCISGAGMSDGDVARLDSTTQHPVTDTTPNVGCLN